MLSDQLSDALRRASATDCVAILKDLDETTRRNLYPLVADVAKGLTWQRIEDQPHLSFDQHQSAGLALLATATFAQLKALHRSGPWWWPTEETQAVLTHRRPTWLAEWAEFALVENFRMWPIVRHFVRQKWIAAPQTEFYTLGMVAAPRFGMPVRTLLESDPELLSSEFWQIFEVEGSGELSLAAVDKGCREQMRWSTEVQSLVEDSTIKRSQVLQSTLDALRRDFAPFRAGWFSRMHELLNPTSAERLQHRDSYLRLVQSRVPTTVSFAIKALSKLHKVHPLDISSVIKYFGPAFEARDQGTINRALSIVKELAFAADLDLNSKLAALVARSLAHESAEVQKAAIEFIGEQNSSLIDPYLDLLAPSVRPMTNQKAPIVPIPLLPSMGEAPVDRVQPLDSLSSLIEAFSRILETQDSPMEIERVIDGVARIGINAAIHEKEFQRLTAALAKRANKLINGGTYSEPRRTLCHFALAWIRGARQSPPTEQDDLFHFLQWRIWCASEQAALRIERNLLSLPTESDGRIDPVELDTRIQTLSAAERSDLQDKESLFHLDYLLANLRANGYANPAPIHLVWIGSAVAYNPLLCSHQRTHMEGWPPPSRFEPARLSAVDVAGWTEMTRWCSTVSPRWRDGWFSAGCCAIASNIDWWEACWANRVYLEPLLHPKTIVGNKGALLIAFALSSKEIGEATLATDALIATFEQSRLDPTTFATAMTEAASSGAIKFSRWAKQLQIAARVSSAMAVTIFHALESVIESGHMCESSSYLNLLQFQLELKFATRLNLTKPGAIATLSGLKAGGKTAKAIAQLLKQD